MKTLLKTHGYKLIAAALVIAVLTGAFVLGGGYARSDVSGETADMASSPPPSAIDTDIQPEFPPETEKAPAADDVPVADETMRISATETVPPEEPDISEPDVSMPLSSGPEIPEPSQEPAEQPGMDINPDTGKDKYLTGPVPEGKPVPVEPQDVMTGAGSFTCTLTIRCDAILDNMDWLDVEKHELVPGDGVILSAVTVTFYEGESVFDVLRRETKRAKIHMEYVNVPMYNSAYIEGINNLYEFDVGELSGWMYKVNDWFPNYGCSRYLLSQDDVIEWAYTCDLGRDVGGYYATGGGS